jgi:hypothetical protein
MNIAGIIGLGGIGSGIGAAIGAGTTHQEVVYRAPAFDGNRKVVLAPIVSKHGAGLTASMRF